MELQKLYLRRQYEGSDISSYNIKFADYLSKDFDENND